MKILGGIRRLTCGDLSARVLSCLLSHVSQLHASKRLSSRSAFQEAQSISRVSHAARTMSLIFAAKSISQINVLACEVGPYFLFEETSLLEFLC